MISRQKERLVLLLKGQIIIFIIKKIKSVDIEFEDYLGIGCRLLNKLFLICKNCAQQIINLTKNK